MTQIMTQNMTQSLTKGESIRKKGLYYKSINLLSLLLPFLSLNKEMIKTSRKTSRSKGPTI